MGYIDSPEGRAALGQAIEEARRRGATLLVVHSLRGGAREDSKVLAADGELKQVGARLAGESIRYEIRELVRGNPAGKDLVEFAHQQDAELIVIGLRRRSPVGKLVLGSNAQDVLLHADCPVLAVKAGREQGGSAPASGPHPGAT